MKHGDIIEVEQTNGTVWTMKFDKINEDWHICYIECYNEKLKSKSENVWKCWGSFEHVKSLKVTDKRSCYPKIMLSDLKVGEKFKFVGSTTNVHTVVSLDGHPFAYLDSNLHVRTRRDDYEVERV